MIDFLCPNGHKIRCPDDQAGKPAKCPRCSARFLVPNLHADDVEPTSTAAAESEPASRSGIRRNPPRERQIDFLCPNGHRLNGPASLQGRPGQCPECGSKFRIPTYDEISEEEELQHDIGVGRADGQSGSDSHVVTPSVVDESSAARTATGLSATGAANVPASPHPMSQVFARLWVEKARGATIELHLDGGDILVPEQFLKGLSGPTLAVFAVKEENGSFAVNAVNWACVQRLVVRNVKKLPDTMA